MMWKMSDEADVEGEVHLEDEGEDYTRERQGWLPEDPEALKERLLERESIGYLRGRDRGRRCHSEQLPPLPRSHVPGSAPQRD